MPFGGRSFRTSASRSRSGFCQGVSNAFRREVLSDQWVGTLIGARSAGLQCLSAGGPFGRKKVKTGNLVPVEVSNAFRREVLSDLAGAGLHALLHHQSPMPFGGRSFRTAAFLTSCSCDYCKGVLRNLCKKGVFFEGSKKTGVTDFYIPLRMRAL